MTNYSYSNKNGLLILIVQKRYIYTYYISRSYTCILDTYSFLSKQFISQHVATNLKFQADDNQDPS